MLKYGIWIALILLLLAVIYILWANKAIVTTEYQFRSQKVPEAFDGFRIVQVSDLQSETFGANQETLLRKIKNAEPDLIVFTGDLADRNHTDYGASLTAMEGLCQIAPVCYVNGNHELALPVDDVTQMYDKMRAMGITLLFDRGVPIARGGQEIFLAGISEETLYAAKTGAYPAEDAARKDKNLGRGKISDTDIAPGIIEEAMAQALKGAECKELQILLVHEPQFLQTYALGSADLILSGHAHGGQIRLPFTQGLFAPGQGILPKLTSGKHRWDGAEMIISRGLGNSTFPLRIFNRPELVVITLHPKG